MSRDEQMRLLGHRDGIVTGLLQVRQQIRAIEYRYEHVAPRHTRKLATKAHMLQPLKEVEAALEHARVAVQSAYDKETQAAA